MSEPAWIPRLDTFGSRLRALRGVDATAHQLRHYFGSKVWAATKDLRVTQEMLRHQDPKSTATYAAWDSDLAVHAVTGLTV